MSYLKFEVGEYVLINEGLNEDDDEFRVGVGRRMIEYAGSVKKITRTGENKAQIYELEIDHGWWFGADHISKLSNYFIGSKAILNNGKEVTITKTLLEDYNCFSHKNILSLGIKCVEIGGVAISVEDIASGKYELS